MPEVENGIRFFSLLEVMSSIQKTIISRYSSSFWVKAEMIKLNHYVQSGHCYPDLVEKSNGKVVAQSRSVIWKSDFEMIKEKFESVTKEPIKDGITILFNCRITFDTLHGLSLRIIDIDPMFSLGELEKERQETIKKLKEEGIFDKNKKLTLPKIPQRLAIISVITSKGYADFIKIIDQEPNQYKLFMHLFPSLLQGDKAVDTMIQALDTIEKVKHHFDAVLIVRGGGGDLGLTCYNNYELVKKICNFPIPLLTGIGHSTNETVSEMVSYKNCITPTELADFILNHFRIFDFELHDLNQKLARFSLKRIETESQKINQYTQLISINSKNRIAQEERILNNIKEHIIKDTNNLINNTSKELSNIEKIVTLLDPSALLKKGYSISYTKNKAIKSIKGIKVDDEIITLVSDGKITSKVIDTTKNN